MRCCVTDLTTVLLGRIVEGFLEPCTGKAVEFSEIRGMFCGILEDKNAESNVDNGGLACKLQGGSKDSIGTM